MHKLQTIVTDECGVCPSVCLSRGVIRCSFRQITLASCLYCPPDLVKNLELAFHCARLGCVAGSGTGTEHLMHIDSVGCATGHLLYGRGSYAGYVTGCAEETALLYGVGQCDCLCVAGPRAHSSGALFVHVYTTW